MPRTQLGSDSLPREFFAPGFRAPIDDLPAKVQQQFHELRTATPSLLRVIAIGGGLSWALLLTQTFNPHSTPVLLIAWGMLFTAAVVLLVAGVGKVEKLYQPVMAAGALVYFLLLGTHSVYLLISGDSPLNALKLGDYSAIPAALFVVSWPFFWAPWVALLLCAYLAKRNRPLAGWGAWIGCMVIAQLYVWSGIQTDYISPSNSWAHSLVLLPASILPWMVKRISDGLPLLISEQRAAAATAAVGLARQRFLDSARDWLSTRITMLFIHSFTPEQTSLAAYLLEQRLRDSIRSPLLDRPAITAGTWDARLHGVKVKLLDDYSPTTHHNEGPIRK